MESRSRAGGAMLEAFEPRERKSEQPLTNSYKSTAPETKLLFHNPRLLNFCRGPSHMPGGRSREQSQVS